MISPHQIQERRRYDLLRRQLGPQLLTAIADPEITDCGAVGPHAIGCL
jgi:hypothetical protein